MSHRKGRRPPGRRPSRDAVRRQLLAFVEGLRTEELYLNHWHRIHRDRVIVNVDKFRGGPKQLVEHAVERQRDEQRDARKGRGDPHDEIWCVFDIDQHPNIAKAIAMAGDHGIHLAISNPCLELWFILHFENQTAWIDRKDAQQRSESLLGAQKAPSTQALDLLVQHHGAATTRARQLDRKHAGDGSPQGANPSSSIWRLIDSIRRA